MGDVYDPGKYRGITLLSHVLEILVKILDGRIKRRKEKNKKVSEEGWVRLTGC